MSKVERHEEEREVERQNRLMGATSPKARMKTEANKTKPAAKRISGDLENAGKGKMGRGTQAAPKSLLINKPLASIEEGEEEDSISKNSLS